MRALTLTELATESGAPIDLVEWLLARGQLRPLADGRFDARDSAILSTVEALLDSGISRDDLGGPSTRRAPASRRSARCSPCPESDPGGPTPRSWQISATSARAWCRSTRRSGSPSRRRTSTSASTRSRS